MEVPRRTNEGTAGLRAGAGRVRAHSLVVAGLVVGYAAPAAVLVVGVLDPGGGDDAVHREHRT